MYTKKDFKKGFTLVETLVYVFVLALIVSVSSMTVISSVKVFAQVKSDRNIIESGSLVMERMTREIRQANSVDTLNSVFSSSPGSLALSVDENGTTYTRVFSISDNEVVLTEDGLLVGSLTSNSSVLVTSLIFNNITTSAGNAIKITITIQDIKSSKSETFYNTVSLRGAY